MTIRAKGFWRGAREELIAETQSGKRQAASKAASTPDKSSTSSSDDDVQPPHVYKKNPKAGSSRVRLPSRSKSGAKDDIAKGVQTKETKEKTVRVQYRFDLTNAGQ